MLHEALLYEIGTCMRVGVGFGACVGVGNEKRMCFRQTHTLTHSEPCKTYIKNKTFMFLF